MRLAVVGCLSPLSPPTACVRTITNSLSWLYSSRKTILSKLQETKTEQYTSTSSFYQTSCPNSPTEVTTPIPPLSPKLQCTFSFLINQQAYRSQSQPLHPSSRAIRSDALAFSTIKTSAPIPHAEIHQLTSPHPPSLGF